jgi:serine protease
MMRRTLVLMLAVTPFVPGCSCEDFFDEPDGGFGGGLSGPSGSVSGTVTPFRGADSARLTPLPVEAELRRAVLAQVNGPVLPRAPETRTFVDKAVREAPVLHTNDRLLGLHQPQEIVSSELIVRFTEKLTAARALAQLSLKGSPLVLSHGGFASDFLHLIRFRRADGKPLTDGETRELLPSIAWVNGVRFVELNHVRHPLAVPNDSLYPSMWHLTALNLPAAWELEKGSAGTVTIAVIDTGIVQHPDLNPRVLAGYDMVTDATRAQDGDGRDSDATDPGRDLPNGGSSWHGSHCAGTIGAVTDNSSGISGVNWNARIVPVRVLGKGGGTDFDIAAGMTWASGGNVPGAAANANPASVISMSLGGQGEATQTYQDAIDSAAPRNAIFVVAAGNDNIDASQFTPCNQTGVLCIGATRFNGTRASYSNYGQRIDVVAPGGETAEDSNGDGKPDGVLSTVLNQAGTMPFFEFEQGTSMATPHVAGIISLMKARNPAITYAQAKQILVETANTSSRCNEGCGAGLVNAHAALLRVSGQQTSGPAKLSLSATDVFFTTASSTQALGITNLGGQPLNVTFAAGGAEAARLSFMGGATRTIAPGQSGSIQVVADLQGLSTSATAAATISVTSNGGNASVGVKLRAGGAGGRNVVVALVHQVNGEWKVAGATEAQAINNFAFTVAAPVGSYFLFGAQDANGNGQFEDAEPIGIWPNTDSPKTIDVTDRAMIAGRNFVVVPQVNVSDDAARVIGTPCTDDGTCGPGGTCALGFPQGYCTKDCSTAACPTGAKCLSGSTLSICLDTCTGPRRGGGTCRANYVCEDDGSGTGVCIPNCNTIQDFCDAPQTCSATSGYCE